jgi:hypothetical protein
MQSPIHPVPERRSKTVAARSVSLFLAATLLIGLCAVFAADFWEKKDYTQWSQQECKKILEDSPWSQPYLLQGFGGGGIDGAPQITYTIQFRSAIPVRWAQVRNNQIASKYDKLSPEQKAQFDQSVKEFMSIDYENVVVLDISYEHNMPSQDLTIARHWQTQTADLLKQSVYLYGSKGKKVPLLDYKIGQGAQRKFQFIFPRQFEGRAVATPEDKNIVLEFTYPVVSGVGDGRGRVEFNVKKMTINGQLVY